MATTRKKKAPFLIGLFLKGHVATASKYPNYFLPVACVAALALLDQLVKSIIRGTLDPSHSISLPATFSLVQIVHISNTGSIFGTLKGTQLFISALSVAVIVFLVITYRELGTRLQRAGALLIIAGAVGNTIDRLVFGRVTDFIYVRPWPAFNLADTFLFFGAVLLLLSLIKKNRTN